MANHLQDILSRWYPLRDQYRWVLASVVDIDGSNYRKVGAMMLINELGQYYGLISGGCLEKNLLHDVKKVLTYDYPLRVCFDSSETGDMPWARALGCGGRVSILLQPVNATHNYQSLDSLYHALNANSESFYAIQLQVDSHTYLSNKILSPAELNIHTHLSSFALKKNISGDELLIFTIRPPIHVVIFGGGIDAIPLMQMAQILGWKITVIDKRVGYADAASFPNVQIIRAAAYVAEVDALLATVDAAILMTHNISLDAEALVALQAHKLGYIGLLGPAQRKQKVLQHAGLAADAVIYGPMGFDIGGDLPESVALSVLAQCHQVLLARTNVNEQEQAVVRRNLS